MEKRTLLTQAALTKKTYTDAQLVCMLRSTESRIQDQALNHLLRPSGDIYLMVKKMTSQHNGDMHDFSELLQEGLIALNTMVIRPSFELKARLKTIMYRICYNIWMKELGRRNKYTEIGGIPVESMGFTTMAEPQLSKWDKVPEMLYYLTGCLPHKLKKVLVMRYLEELPYDEIQTAFNYKSYAVTRNAVSRGIGGLKKIVGQEPKLRELLVGLQQA